MAALFGFAALISPPFRPQFLSATTVLSDLFLETLAFSVFIAFPFDLAIKIAEIKWPALVLKYYRQVR
jgi:hypothetical protein